MHSCKVNKLAIPKIDEGFLFLTLNSDLTRNV